MALPRDYTGQACSLARSLEVLGERWTLLIVRDAFYGVRRFSDFVAHLDIPRAVLTERLGSLVKAGVLARVLGTSGRDEYELTDKGRALWPVVRSLTSWGDNYYAQNGPRRVFLHAEDDGPLSPAGICAICGEEVDVGDTLIAPGPGLEERGAIDVVTTVLRRRHRLLTPIAGPAS